jgi:ATP-dependent protease ClpP protease subunit
MPDWTEILEEIDEIDKSGRFRYDTVRRKYLRDLSEQTGRNTIVYYSAWLQKPELNPLLLGISDDDKNGFMTTIHGLDRKKGLDLILHTPGGETAATESIVDYLRNIFDTDIRAIIPQIALSSGTMIACACKKIFMGKQSSLGPIDPQFRGIPAHGVIEEFKRAYEECKKDPRKIHIWQPIIANYSPAFIGECEKAIEWSEEMVRIWLSTGMFKEDPEANTKIQRIIEELTSHALTKSHARHLSTSRCKEFGLDVEMLEDNQEFQDAVLSVHHACIHTFAGTNAFKIIENQNGKAFVRIATIQ